MPNDSFQINQKQMLDAIKRSGYLMEQRIQTVLEKADYFVDMNPVYLDPTTNKTREYDFSAFNLNMLNKDERDMIWMYLHGECINNPQPLVFFSYEEQSPVVFVYNVKCTGIPLRFFPYNHGNGNEEESIEWFLRFNDWHHYCHGIHSTQYCSFHKKGNKNVWMAWHEDLHHSVFESLIQSVEQVIDKYFSSWSLPTKDEKEYIDLTFYYPVVVLSGDLFECVQKKGKPELKKREHIQYHRSIISGKSTKTYHVDVVTESFFPKYLDIIQEESAAIVNRLRRHKKQVLASVDKIVALASEAAKKHKIKNFRDVLTG